MSRCYIPPPAVFNRFLINAVCAKCGKPFSKIEPVVNKTHGSGSKQQFRWYHKNCFTDAKGVPIHE